MSGTASPSAGAVQPLLDHLAREGADGLFGSYHDRLGGPFQARLARSDRQASGQFYTPATVADLACAFAIRRADCRVLDPSCGSGAFLLRALARLHLLDPDRTRTRHVHGVDVSPIALWLAAVNLAARGVDLDGALHAADFFALDPGGSPPQVDSIVGNPPYVQQEDLPGTGPGSKVWIRDRVRRETGAALSGRSDLHGFFWPQAARFLRPGGRIALVTSSPWLDAGYGAGLRRWMLEGFAVEAVIESADEPWFTDARVITSLTVLRPEPCEVLRRENLVRFVQLRQPLAELVPGGDEQATAAASELRDDLMAASGDVRVERFALRTVRQADLAPAAGRTEGKWGRHLRGPRVWFALRRQTASHWCALGDRVRLRRGLTTGCDRFFFVRPGAGPAFRGFDGDKRPLEPRFLQPEIHSVMEVDRFSIRSADCSRSVLMVGQPADSLEGTEVFDYIQAAEAADLHRGATCAGRARTGRPWYDLTGHRPGALLWPKERQYRHVVPLNPEGLPASCRFYELHPPAHDTLLWAGLLNSTWALLASLQYGRPMGVEANHSTMAADLRIMPVPDPATGTADQRAAIAIAFQRMSTRPPLPFLPSDRRCELDQPDRRDLDRAVLDLLGIADPADQDRWLDELYSWLREHFERARVKEERATRNRRKQH